MLRKGMFLADRYEILDQIGTGGMSDVYKAKCHKLNRFVAIKILKQEFSDDKSFVSKFRIEAQSAAGLTHPNVVNVYDVGDENGVYYIVMELVEGITLKKYIDKKGKLTSKEAISIAIQIGQGIESAHSHHIIHRDIKPQNIIISKDGKVKVTDFGIARASTTNTISSATMGSVHYISPEQARGGYSDEKSDIYSFGITIYEMLTGKVPFDGDSTVAIAVQHIQEEIPSPSTVIEDIPISIDKIVMKCTQKKTERRYQNVTDLIADLKKSLVMPDVDFVKIVPIYADSNVTKVEASGINNDMVTPIDINENKVGGFEDDLEDDILVDDDGFVPNILLDEDDEDDDDDIEDGGNEKLDKIVKWIGIGIVALIIIVAIFIVVKIAGVFGDKNDPQEVTTEISTQTQLASVNNENAVTVPQLKGMTEEEVKVALNKVGLGYKPTYQPSETIEKGKVITQGQAAGSKVDKNTTITVSISEGINQFQLSSVVNMIENEATAMLKNLKLEVAVEYAFSDTIAQGIVISQTPTANKTVKAGDTVKIIVSKGKEIKDKTMPNLLNNTESDAKKILDALGLDLTIKTTTQSSSAAAGTVISQSYSEGTKIKTGDTINLTISSGPTVPDLSKLDQIKAKAEVEKMGLIFKATEVTSELPKGAFVSQEPAKGVAIAPNSTVIYNYSKGPTTPTPAPSPSN